MMSMKARPDANTQAKWKQWLTLGLAGMALNLAINYFFHEDKHWSSALISSLVTLVFVIVLAYVVDLVIRKWMHRPEGFRF